MIHDLHQSTIIPEALQESILIAGGRNLYGDPLFRLILAQDRYMKAHGIWQEWGGVNPEDRGKLPIMEIVKMVQRGASEQECNEVFHAALELKPERTTVGYKEIPYYGADFKGFVLEKWNPPDSWGPPHEWYAYTFGGEAALGPYPSEGIYEYIAGPTPYMPTAQELRQAISEHYRQLDNRPRSAKERLAILMARFEEEHKREMRATRDEIYAQVSDGPGSLYNRLSLGAGRVRNELATRAGLEGHWGN